MSVFTADPVLTGMFGGIAALLLLASIIGLVLQWRARSPKARSTVANLNARTGAWWIMVVVIAAAAAFSKAGFITLFFLLSFLALREFYTLTPTRRSDHRTLFWVFFIILPLNYWFIAIEWYAMWSIFIPVYGFLFIPLRSAMRGDPASFLERSAKIQWGAMIAIYCLSHAPAIMLLDLPGYAHSNAVLLLYMLIVVQFSDVMQYVWGKTLGRWKVAPVISPSKTVEGLVGGVASAALLGTLLFPITPFAWWQALAISLLVAMMGFAGGLVMSAVKRDMGVKDYGELLPGHGGILDRLDSVCFAAPVFFHVVRYFFTP